MRAANVAIRVGCIVTAAAVLVGTRPEVGLSAATAATPVVVPARATATAARISGPQPVSTCQQIAFQAGLRQPGASQVVVVRTDAASSTVAALQIADRTANGWSCGASMTARVGRNGVRPLLARRSGDGTTPAGVFPLGRMTAWDGRPFSVFGNSPDPGVTAGPYRRVVAGDCFGATPQHPDYGHLVSRPSSGCADPDEYLPAITGAYEHAALIGANMEPNVSGDAPGEIPYASAIFLHRVSFDAAGRTKPTAGCVSLGHTDLVNVLRWMRPGVLFAIGETSWLLANA